MARRRSRQAQPKFSQKDLERTVERTVLAGINKLVTKHPRLQGIAKYLVGNIDETQLRHAMWQLYQQEKDHGFNKEQMKDYIISGISQGVANGGYFNQAGKELVLEEGKKQYGKLAAMLHPVVAIKRKLNPDYLDRAIDSFSMIYDVMESGGYRNALPEKLKGNISEMKELGFYNAMVDILYHKKVIPGRAALYGKGRVREKAKKTVKESLEEMKTRLAAILIAASFLLLGFSASHMTGFVIASNKIPAGYPIAAGFILLIIALCLSFLRKKKKKQGRKIRKRSRKIRK